MHHKLSFIDKHNTLKDIGTTLRFIGNEAHYICC